MNQLLRVLQQITHMLQGCQARFALVGGFAVSAQTEPRFTRDIDLAIAVQDDREAEQLVRSLMMNGYQSFAHLEQEEVHRLATVRLAKQEGDHSNQIIVDLLFASSGIEPEIVEHAETLTLYPGLKLPVATKYHLIALKILARDDQQRPQDFSDLRMLLKEATPSDLTSAYHALEMITKRGFSRGRDLTKLLEDTITTILA